MYCIAALLGGLFLGFRDLVPYVAARRSGVITRKGAQNIRVRRDTDPEAFARLLANRSKGAVIGLGVFAFGLLGLGLYGLSLTNSVWAALVIVGIYVCFGLFAIVCLVRGFSTGRMFAFWSLTLFGEATRKENATWFWVYSGMNLLVALFAAFVVLGTF
jgi:hypothetical protein